MRRMIKLNQSIDMDESDENEDELTEQQMIDNL